MVQIHAVAIAFEVRSATVSVTAQSVSDLCTDDIDGTILFQR